jgi:Flp pilus assembly protein TadB
MAQYTDKDAKPHLLMPGAPAWFVLLVAGCLLSGFFVNKTWQSTLMVASGIAVAGLIAAAYLWRRLGKRDKALAGVLAVTVVSGLCVLIGAM